MKHNCKSWRFRIYTYVSIFLMLSIFISLFIFEFAFASNEIDFYTKCVSANHSEEMNKSTNNVFNLYSQDRTPSFKDCILNNLDVNYCSENKFEAATLIVLKQTLADSSLFPKDANLDDLHYGNYADAEIAMYDEYCVLYDVDDSSEYYVGFVNTIEGDVQDYIFAKTNYHGEVLNDCIYDGNTGLIYVPKSYTKNKGEDGKESVLEVQMQLLVSVLVENDKVASSVDISIENDGNEVEHAKIKLNALDTFLVVPANDIDLTNASVIANNNIDITEKSYFDNGNIYINESPVNINSVKIEIQKSVQNKNSNTRLSTSIGEMPCLPYTVNRDICIGGDEHFDHVGAKFVTQMEVHYTEVPSKADYQDCLYGPDGFVTEASMQTFADRIWNNSGSVDLSNLRWVSDGSLNLFTFYPYEIFKESCGGLALKCGHISTPVTHDERIKWVHTKILEINTSANYALLGFVTEVAGYTDQGGCGIYKVRFESRGGCQMKKDTSLNWSKDNDNYKLRGTEYFVFYDESCSGQTDTYIVLDENGYGHTEKDCLEAYRTYYVREAYGAHGKNYNHNDTVGEVYISKINSYENDIVWKTGSTTYDTPCYEKIPIVLWKTDAQLDDPGITEGSVPSFGGALYDFQYYTGYFREKEDIPYFQDTYKRHWIMQTDDEGKVSLDENYRNNKVGGDEFYLDENNEVCCPYGTYVIHETKAPEGYLLSDKYYLMWVYLDTTNGEHTATCRIFDGDTGLEIETMEDPQTGSDYIKALEQVIRGDYKFTKTDPNMRELSGIPFKISSVTTGEWHIVVSDDNGVIDTSSQKNLHTNNTNINDYLYDPISKRITDESALSSNSGCWFAINKRTSQIADPVNDVGALPYDTYTIEELLVSKNETYYPFAARSFVISNNGYIIEGGTWVNSKNTCVTKARGTSGNQEIEASANEEVFDRVFYGGLINSHQYEIKAWLVEQSSGNMVPINYIKNEEYYVYTSFLANDSIGYVDVSTFIDSRPYINANLVWFIELYDTDFSSLIIDHKDIIDTDETLYVVGPSFETDLMDDVTGEKLIEKKPDEVLVDQIIYNKLKPGLSYSFVGTLYNKKLQKPCENILTGENIVATCNLIPTNPNGSISIYYELDTSILADNTELVSCVELYIDDICIYSSNSLDNERETVKVTELKLTTFASTIENEKTFVADNPTNIVDKINYFNFTKDKSVSLYSWFSYADTGLPVTDKNISVDEAFDSISSLLDIFGGKFMMTNSNISNFSDSKDKWLVEFFDLPKKLDTEKLKNFNWDQTKHIMFSRKTFTPTEKDGTELINFKFDTSECLPGNIVAYTIAVMDNTVLLAKTDINDIDETLSITKNDVPAPGNLPKTSDTLMPLLLALLVLCILMLGYRFNFYRRGQQNFSSFLRYGLRKDMGHINKKTLRNFNDFFSDI